MNATPQIEEVELLKHLEQEDKFRCEDSLYYFIKAAWHVVEPGKVFYDNWHIRAICEALEKAQRHEIQRLIINIPPRLSVLLCFPSGHGFKTLVPNSYLRLTQVLCLCAILLSADG